MSEFIDDEDCHWDSYEEYFVCKYAASIGFYNSELSNIVVRFLRWHEQDRGSYWYTTCADELEIPEVFAEALKDVFCESDLLEYGTSPRGAWLSGKGRDILRELRQFT